MDTTWVHYVAELILLVFSGWFVWRLQTREQKMENLSKDISDLQHEMYKDYVTKDEHKQDVSRLETIIKEGFRDVKEDFRSVMEELKLKVNKD